MNSLSTKLILALLATSWVSSCAKEDPLSKIKSSDGLNAYNPEKNGLAYIDPRPAVSAYKLDEVDFRVNGIRVGKQQFMTSETPAVLFFRPQMADYVEIIRCKEDVIIQAGTEVLSNIDVGTSSAADETKIMQSHDFWGAAEKKNGCLLVAQNYSNKEIFFDSFVKTSPTGSSFRYLIRSCVNSERLAETEGLTERNCSKQVSTSPVLKNYINKRQENERVVLADLTRLQTQMDALGRHLYYTTIEYNNALKECEEANYKLDKRLAEKRAIAGIIGQGVSIAGAIYGSNLQAQAAEDLAVDKALEQSIDAGTAAEIATADTAIDKAVSAASDGFNWEASFNATWNAKNVVGGVGSSVAGMLLDLFASPNDYPRSCTRAKEAQTNGTNYTQQLKDTNKLFLIKLDQVKTVQANNRAAEGGPQ